VTLSGRLPYAWHDSRRIRGHRLQSFIRFNSAKAPWYSVKSILAKADVPTVSKALEFALRMAN
jgi:hypothetical protein